MFAKLESLGTGPTDSDLHKSRYLDIVCLRRFRYAVRSFILSRTSNKEVPYVS